mmetsp:Transcript_10737/g.16041  ORF Transcript_10737/g.16041 Transcript_10737/m.16041 type:complete len:341 (-) Transcript_10737:549-1571(-)
MKKLSKRLIQKIIPILAAILLLLESSPIRTINNTIKRKTTISTDIGYVTDPIKETDTPLYWHIFKSGGSSMKAYYSCMGLVVASRQGIFDHIADETLQVIEDKSTGHKYVNVDTADIVGMIRAKRLGLASSGLADIIFSPLLTPASNMFDAQHQGRFFALFRHPIERAVSMFYYRQVASWERDPNVYKPDLAKVDIEDWLKNRGGKADVSNFLMSSLLGKRYFSEKDLEKAKEILRSKVLVGLLSKMEESVQHFDTYFGWYENNEKRSKCQDSAIQKGVNRNPHESVEEGSEAWELLADLNYYDLQLYEYILELYEEQGRELFGEGVEQKVEESTTITSE